MTELFKIGDVVLYSRQFLRASFQQSKHMGGHYGKKLFLV